MPVPNLPEITEKITKSERLTTRVLFNGAEDGIPVLFLHGNGASATFWEETMLALLPHYRAIAPDQRGYGDAEKEKKIDATRGMGDFADDAFALLDTLKIDRAHGVGHAMGGAVIWRMMLDHPERLRTVTLINPISPYGLGGTKGIHGKLCTPDGAGSGGGTVNPAFAQAIQIGERSTDHPQISPRNVMTQFYFKPPFVSPREEDLLSSMLSQHIGEQEYPGDFVASPNWPFVAPGKWGAANALSPLYMSDVSGLNAIKPKPSVLWIRGSDDQIVSDQSLFDMGTLGAMGALPGWTGVDNFPSQPMVGQTRAVLEAYQSAGGRFEEVVIPDTGHTPYLEKPHEFNALFHRHLGEMA